MLQWVAPVVLARLIDIVGSSTCPEPAAVTQRLATLVVDAQRVRAGEVRIELDGPSIRIERRSPQGRVIATRALARVGSCADLAAAAAVVIASWESQSRPELPELAAKDAAPATAPRVGPWALELSGALMLASDGETLAPGGRVDLELLRNRTAGYVGLFGITGRQRAIGPGQATFRHLGLAVGVGTPLIRADWRVDLRGELITAALIASGAGFSRNYDEWSFDPGLSGGLMAGRVIGSAVELFADAAMTGWLRESRVTASEMQTNLPRLEFWLSLGMRWESTF
jgi:hypothetical protein